MVLNKFICYPIPADNALYLLREENRWKDWVAHPIVPTVNIFEVDYARYGGAG